MVDERESFPPHQSASYKLHQRRILPTAPGACSLPSLLRLRDSERARTRENETNPTFFHLTIHPFHRHLRWALILDYLSSSSTVTLLAPSLLASDAGGVHSSTSLLTWSTCITKSSFQCWVVIVVVVVVVVVVGVEEERVSEQERENHGERPEGGVGLVSVIAILMMKLGARCGWAIACC